MKTLVLVGMLFLASGCGSNSGSGSGEPTPSGESAQIEVPPQSQPQSQPVAPSGGDSSSSQREGGSSNGACYTRAAKGCNQYTFYGNAAQVSSWSEGFRKACTGDWSSRCPSGAAGGCEVPYTLDRGAGTKIVMYFYDQSKEFAKQACDVIGGKFVNP